ncbi:molybdopterin-dependent oxidoreductase [Desulfocurvus sp. DL9XJH121]
MSDAPLVSACTRNCGDCCSLVVERGEDGLSFRGNPEHPFTRGFICAKTRAYPELLRHPARITTPLVREGSGYWPVTWDEALSLIARRLDRLRATPERILHVRGHGRRGVFCQAPNWFFARLGAATLSGSPCDESGIAASILDFGALDHNHPEDVLNAERIVNWGRDIPRTSVHLAALVRRARKQGTRVLTISPGGDGSGRYSDRHVRLRPGTDRFLAAALAEALARGAAPEIRDAASNFPALAELLEDRDTDALLAACDVSRADFEEILSWYAQPGPTATILAWGMQRYVHGAANVRWVNAVAMLSGNVGRAGGGSYYNISSGRNLADWTAGADEGRTRRTFPIHDLGRSLLEADPPVGLVWIEGGNPVTQLPAGDVLAEALARCPLVVAVEAFFTDTALRADLILPCALMGEREEALGSCLHDWVNWAAKVADPPGEARDDWELFTDLGRRLADPLVLPDREEVLARALDSPSLRTTPEELRARGFVRGQWPAVAFEGLNFAHADGRYRFIEELPAEPAPDPAYPLNLLTLVSDRSTQSQPVPGDLDSARDGEPSGPPEAFVSPDCPGLAGLDRDAPVYVASPRGRVEVRLVLDGTLHPGAVLARRGGWMSRGQSLTPLVQPRETDLAGGTAYYSQGVRLEN